MQRFVVLTLAAALAGAFPGVAPASSAGREARRTPVTNTRIRRDFYI